MNGMLSWWYRLPVVLQVFVLVSVVGCLGACVQLVVTARRRRRLLSLLHKPDEVHDIMVPRYTCPNCGRKALRAVFGQGVSVADTMGTFRLQCERCGHVGATRG